MICFHSNSSQEYTSRFSFVKDIKCVTLEVKIRGLGLYFEPHFLDSTCHIVNTIEELCKTKANQGSPTKKHQNNKSLSELLKISVSVDSLMLYVPDPGIFFYLSFLLLDY